MNSPSADPVYPNNSDLASQAQSTQDGDIQNALARHPSEAVRLALKGNPFLCEEARKILDAHPDEGIY